MKYPLIGSFLIFATTFNPSFSQKLDLDKEYWDMTYINVPKNNALASLNTYSAVVYGEPSNLNRIGLTTDKIEAALKLNGYVYSPDEGDIHIEVNVDNFRILSETVESREVSESTTSGSVTKRVYFASSKYVVPTTINIITSSNNEILIGKTFGNNQNPIVIESSTYPTYDAANNYLKGSADKRMESFRARYVETFFSLFDAFKQNFDFIVKKETEVFWHIDLKKAPEFAEFNDKLAAAKEIFAGIKPYDDLKPAREKMAPILQYWKENADKTPSDDKKGKKLKYAYLINLSRAQLWLEMLDEAEASAKQLIDNDYDKLDGKNLLLSVKYFRDEIKRSPAGSRHFMREGFTSTNHYRAHDIQPKVVPFKYPKPPVGFTAFPGFVINYSKEKINGQLWAKMNGSRISFYPKDGTKFVYEENKELKEMPIDLKVIDEISLGRDDRYERIKFKNTIGHPETDLLFKVLFENDNYKILAHYTANEPSAGLKATGAVTKLIGSGDFCIMKKSTGVIAPVGSLVAKNAAENTAAYYNTCASLQNKILAEEFGKMNTLEAQVKALEYFETSCK